MGWSRYDSYWKPYVSVAERKKNAAKHVDNEKKKGKSLNPVVIEGRAIAKSFWGKAWCDNLESYSDFQNRLPRGRSYAKNGSVIDLQITAGEIAAQVMGSSLYKITIKITPMIKVKWKELVNSCSGQIDSLVELLKGLFSKSVMEVMVQKEGGLFPKPKEISMKCSCPDSAYMCKHIAAVLYGVGAMLDNKPEWLFTLRNVEPADLIACVDMGMKLTQVAASNTIEEEDLSGLFGIELNNGEVQKTKVKSVSKKKSAPKNSEKVNTEKKKLPVKKKSVVASKKTETPKKTNTKKSTAEVSKKKKSESKTTAKASKPKLRVEKKIKA